MNRTTDMPNSRNNPNNNNRNWERDINEGDHNTDLGNDTGNNIKDKEGGNGSNRTAKKGMVGIT